MPAHPKPLRANVPKERPPGIDDDIWFFPRNLADQANAADLSPAKVALMASVSPSTVSRWMNYNIGSLIDLRLSEVRALEKGMGLERGTLTRPPVAAKRAG